MTIFATLALVFGFGGEYRVDATCYDQGTITASGEEVRFGMVANNFLAFGTRIWTKASVFGRHSFVVEDHIGSGSELDFYQPIGWTCLHWGRHSIRFWVMS